MKRAYVFDMLAMLAALVMGYLLSWEYGMFWALGYWAGRV